MHELWLCQSILDTLNAKFPVGQAKCIKKVSLELGQLMAIDESALRFSFDVVTQKTVASGAELEIIVIPAIARCDFCNRESHLQQYGDSCQHCGSHALTIIQGEALRIKSMEVD